MAENKRGGRPPRRRSTPEQEAGAIPEQRNGRKKQNNQGAQEPGDIQGAERAKRRTPGSRRRTRQTRETPVPTSGQQEAAQPEPTPSPPEQAQEPAEAPLAPLASEAETPEMAGVVVGAESGEPAEEVRRERHRVSQNNALGLLIEQHFEDPTSPCRSYSDLERRSRISREALSRYVTTRPDRRRSPTIDSLVAIADAMHLSLESVCRAAAAAAKGVIPPPAEVQQTREELVRTLIAALGDEQFSAVVELLIQMRPLGPGSSGSRRPIPQL